MKIVCDDKIPFLKGAFEPFAEVVYLPGKETSADVVRDADAIVTRTRTICNAELLKGSCVKAIATATIGYDHIDTDWCEAEGIAWANAPGCNSSSVQQYIGAALCSIARRRGLDLTQMTLGVVGVGNVGRKVALTGQALGMKVLLNDPPRERREGPEGFVGLERIVADADVITLHVPLTDDGPDATRHLFDAERIAGLKPTQILLNASRGQVVDNGALKAALKAGRLLAAGIDTWEGEPDIDKELMQLLDVCTPHIAGYSADGKANGTTASVRFVAGALGLPLADWSADNLPAPHQPLEFSMDCSGKSAQDIIAEALLYTYDIDADSRALLEQPSAFESLRGNYPVRREPSAFTVTLNGCDDKELASRLQLLGFKIK